MAAAPGEDLVATRAMAGGDRESGSLQRRFDGEDWDLLLDAGWRGEVEQAFCNDAASCLGVSPDDVVILDARVGSLVVDYKVCGCDYEDAVIEEKIAAHDFPELNALYRSRVRSTDGEMAVVATVGVAGLGCELKLQFDGSSWAIVVEEKVARLSDIFKGETAAAVGVPVSWVSLQEFIVTVEGMCVVFGIRDNGTLDRKSMMRRLDDCPFESVWSLYEEDAKSVEIFTSNHEVQFAGDNWAAVEQMEHDALVAAFVAAAARACGVMPFDVVNVVFRVRPSVLRVSFSLRLPSTSSVAEVRAILEKEPYAEVWRLYNRSDSVPTGTVTTKKIFEGLAWEAVVKASRSGLAEAFCSDTCHCLKVPRTRVVIRTMTVNDLGMEIEYSVVDCGIAMSKLAALTRQCGYLAVWSYYPVPKLAPDAILTRTFPASGWDFVVVTHHASVHDAFIRDTADLLGIEKDAGRKVHLNSVYVSDDGLVVNYRVEGVSQSPEAVDRLVRAGAYPQLWALHSRHADCVQSAHGVGFEGEDWDYVIDQSRGAVVNAVTRCTAECLGLMSRDVSDVQILLEPDNGGLVITFRLWHPPTLTVPIIDTALGACCYTAVWELYVSRPFDPSHSFITSHSVLFNGEEWSHTLETKHDAVEAAFRQDVADALGCYVNAVHGIHIEKTGTGMCIGANVSHSALRDTETIQATLDGCDFRRLWALYTSNLPMVGDGHLGTDYRVGFEGDRWNEVLRHHREKLIQAFRADTAEELDISLNTISDLRPEAHDTMLLCFFTILAPHSDEKNTQTTISQCGYNRIWKLYVDSVV